MTLLDDPLRVARLVDALEDVVSGGPAAAALAAAPVVPDWLCVLEVGLPGLYGYVPTRPRGTQIYERDLVHLDLVRGLARTASGWHRLGGRDVTWQGMEAMYVHVLGIVCGPGTIPVSDAVMADVLDAVPAQTLDMVRTGEADGRVDEEIRARLESVVAAWPVGSGLRLDGTGSS